jgi:hypothetical protein
MALRGAAALLLGSLSVMVCQPLLAQPDVDPAQQRAANLARNRAVELNGGLTKYRPAACMFVTGGGACMVRKDSKGYLFRFQGGAPGWVQLKLPATTLTEVLIDPEGRTVLGTPVNNPLSVPAKP